MSLPLSRCLVLPNRLLTFGYGQYSLEVDTGFPATKSSVSQIIEKLDSLPNSARDTAVNNSIVPSDNLAGLGESVLKLYSESSPSAREAIAEMFELACNEPFDNWLDRVERICDGFSKQRECVREFDSLPEAIADALDSEGWTVSDDDVRNLGYLEIERETDLTGYDLVLTIDLRGKDMDSASDWMSAVRNLVYSWDPVEEALIAAGCPDAPSVDRIIEDFKSTYESSISGIEAVCQIVTSAWDEKTAAEDVHSESLDHICERASSAIDDAMDDSRAVGRSEDIDK